MARRSRQADAKDAVSFPSALPAGEQERWDQLTPAQRTRAAARIAAFERWSRGEIDLGTALGATGLSRSRFYRLAADWRSSPSLAAPGAFALGTPGRSRLDPKAVGVLQGLVGQVVRLNQGASVNQMVRHLVDRANLPAASLPGTIRLRNIVEDEVRRVTATGDAGHVLQFDCSAINLPKADGRPYVLFVCVDAGTRLVLGWSVQGEATAIDGYRAVAEDVRERLDSTFKDLPWALRLSAVQLTAGVDEDESIVLVDRLREGGIRNAQLARVPKRFGRYFRAVVGDRVGRVALTPARTAAGVAMPDNGDMTPWTNQEAAAAVAAGLASHNAALLSDLQKGLGRRIPEEVTLVLDLLAEGI